MSFLEWGVAEPEPEKKFWGVTVRRTEVGYIVVEATDEEDALEAFHAHTRREILDGVEWTDTEIYYDSCGGIWEYEQQD